MSAFLHLFRTLPVSYNRKNCRKKKSARSTTQNPRDTQSMKIAIMQKMEVCFCQIKDQDHGSISEPGDLATAFRRFPLSYIPAFGTVALHHFPGSGSDFILESGNIKKKKSGEDNFVTFHVLEYGLKDRDRVCGA